MPPLHLSLPRALAAVEQARLAVLRHLAPLQLAAQRVNSLEIVLEEALMNIVLHGDAPASAAIELTLQVQGHDIVLCLQDDGAEFDATAVQAPARAPTLAQSQPGGLGLTLIRRHARNVAYRRLHGRNVLALTL